MTGCYHTSNISLQTPQGEIMYENTGPPPLKNSQEEESPYYEVTLDQLRALRPISCNLIRGLQKTPVTSSLANPRTPAANHTSHGALVNSLPQLVGLMIEDYVDAVERNSE